MRNRRFILIAGLTGLLIAAALFYFRFQDTPKELAARQHLNDLLGQANANEPENNTGPAETEPSPAPMAPEPDLFFGMPMPTTDIAIEETSDHYVLRIPLKKAEDSSDVKVDVTPHRIEVSGQTSSETAGQSASSSFMQAFTTNQEVLPNQVHRRTEQAEGKTELIITIPKKANSGTTATLPDYAGINDDDLRPTPSQNELVPPNAPASGSDSNSNPLDTYMNRVF
jgi:hypothetical protein